MVDKRQNFFRNEIGVNRGSGFSSASNQKMNDARAFDQIVETVAKKEENRLVTEGKKQATKEARTIGYVFETLDDGTKVPILPEVPEYLTGKTSAETFQKLIFDRYERDVKSQVESIVQDSAQNAKFNRVTPGIYETEALGRLDPLLETVKGTLGDSIKNFAIDKINQYEYNVATTYDAQLRTENRNLHKKLVNDIYSERITSIYSENIDDPALKQKYINSLENAGYTNTFKKEKIKEYVSEGKAHLYVSKNLFKYFNRSTLSPRSIHLSGSDVNRIINFIKTPSEQEVRMSDGKLITRDEINKNITTDHAKKSVLENLKNYKKILKNTSRKVKSNETINTMIDRALSKDDGEFNFLNKKYQPDMNKQFSSLSTAFIENEPEIINRYNNEVAIPNNLPQAKGGVVPEEYKKWTLKTFGILPPAEHGVVISQLSSNQVTKETFDSTLVLYDFLEESDFLTNIKKLDPANREKLISLGVLYKYNNYDKQKTIDEFSQIAQSRYAQSVNDVLYTVQKEGPEVGNTYLNLLVDRALYKDSSADFKALPFAKSKRLIGHHIRNMILLSYKGEFGKAESQYMNDIVRPAAGIILSNSYTNNLQDETPIIETRSTVNKGLIITGQGDKTYAEDPLEYHFGVDYDDLEFVNPDEDDSNRVKYVSDIFKNMTGTDMYVEDGDKKLSVGVQERQLDNYFDGKVKVIPITNYFTEKPDYKLVYVNTIKKNNGDIEERYVDILSRKNNKPIILTAEYLEEEKDNYIMNITSGR